MTDVDEVTPHGDTALEDAPAGASNTARRVWYHTIELPGGEVTPGCYDTRGIARQVPWPARLVGGRCLDVGTFDGFWAFEMERRGAAEVLAVDLDDPRRLDWTFDQRPTGPGAIAQWGSGRGPGFAEASAALGSGVIRKDRSVYDLAPEDLGLFDVVFCGALLLHLRDPVLALERMRSVCRGVLVIAESIDPRLELLAPTMPVGTSTPLLTSGEW